MSALLHRGTGSSRTFARHPQNQRLMHLSGFSPPTPDPPETNPPNLLDPDINNLNHRTDLGAGSGWWTLTFSSLGGVSSPHSSMDVPLSVFPRPAFNTFPQDTFSTLASGAASQNVARINMTGTTGNWFPSTASVNFQYARQYFTPERFVLSMIGPTSTVTTALKNKIARNMLLHTFGNSYRERLVGGFTSFRLNPCRNIVILGGMTLGVPAEMFPSIQSNGPDIPRVFSPFTEIINFVIAQPLGANIANLGIQMWAETTIPSFTFIGGSDHVTFHGGGSVWYDVERGGSFWTSFNQRTNGWRVFMEDR